MHIGILTNIFEKTHSYKEVESDLEEFGKSVKNSLESCGYKVTLFNVSLGTFEELRKAKIDVAFNVCERINGSAMLEPHVASMLEILRIPFTGSSSFTLALCMYKSKIKDILKANNIPTPNYQIFSDNRHLGLKLKFPVIVKPESSHNSIGILDNAVAENDKELKNKISVIIKNLHQPAIVEEFVPGREFGIGILGNNKPDVLPFSEVVYGKDIIPEERILSYKAKWRPKTNIYKKTPYHYNIKLDTKLKEEITEITIKCYKLFNVRDYGTVEIRLDSNNQPKVLELNPNPGLSGHSIIPKIFENSGKSFRDLIEKILLHAMKRYDKNELY